MSDKFIFYSESEDQTSALGEKLASVLTGGEIIFFKGPIGAGKTVMVKAVAKYFGFKKQPASATFSIMRKYKNKNITLYHADLFRLENGEMFNLGFEEMLEDEAAVLLVEWPKAAEDFFPKDRLEIEFILQSGSSRKLKFNSSGKRSDALLEDLCKLIKK